MASSYITERIESVKTELNASSCTFYLRDPFWTNELRLVAMPGVQFTEPMHGFSFSSLSKKAFSDDKDEIFCSDPHTNEQYREETEFSLDRIDPARQKLFGNFIERENIKSSARLIHKIDAHIEAILFVNYDIEKEFSESLKNQIRHQFNKLVEDLTTIKEELRLEDTENINEIDRIFSPTRAGSKNMIYDWTQPLEEYLHSLLNILTESIPELSADNGFGTIHIYENENQTLQMIARSDNIEPEQEFPTLSVIDGEGIVSWVTIRRKALLINDLETSDFKVIHVCVKPGIKSEVAIPIFAGNDLLGVLNLESFVTGAFQPNYVKFLWFAVSQAATAYKLSQQAIVNGQLKALSDGLLELCEESVNKNIGDFSLNKLAVLATEHLKATDAGIWHFNSHDKRFNLVGISDPNYHPESPRSSGFSEYIKQSKCAVWLTRIKDSTDFSTYKWENNSWNQDLPERLPNSLNINTEVKGLLGIPIIVRGKCSGIAWLEYQKGRIIPPSDNFMKLALGFAAHAGLVIEFSLVDLVDKEAVQRIGEVLSENLLAQGHLNLEEFSGIEGYVRSQHYSNSLIGGDFYAAKVIDEQTASVLLGDGEGHAVQGALNMLPMLTVFETFWKETRSATHVMDKIMGISNKLGVKGTAIYCVFSIINKKLWLSATSAGHESLYIFPKEGNPKKFPPEDSAAFGPMLGVPLIKWPLQEEHLPLSGGDLIILLTDGLNLNNDEIFITGIKHKKDPLEVIAEAFFKEASYKRSDEPSDDDETIIVIRVK